MAVWVLDKSARYTVKSAYKLLLLRRVDSDLFEDKQQILQQLWQTAAPLKFLVHVWCILLDRLPTRLALQQRGVVSFQFGPLCVLCLGKKKMCSICFSSALGPNRFGVASAIGSVSVFSWLTVQTHGSTFNNMISAVEGEKRRGYNT